MGFKSRNNLLKEEIRFYFPKNTRIGKEYNSLTKRYEWTIRNGNIIFGRWSSLKKAHEEIINNFW